MDFQRCPYMQNFGPARRECQLRRNHEGDHEFSKTTQELMGEEIERVVPYERLKAWADDHPPRTSDQMAELYKQFQQESLDMAINAYLNTLHSSTWGKMFYITQSDSRETCVEYIRNVIEQVLQLKEEGP